MTFRLADVLDLIAKVSKIRRTSDSPNHNISKRADVEPAEAYSTKRRNKSGRDVAELLRTPRLAAIVTSTFYGGVKHARLGDASIET